MTNLRDDYAAQVARHVAGAPTLFEAGAVAAANAILDRIEREERARAREQDAKRPPDYSAVLPPWPCEPDRIRDRFREEMQSLGLGRKYRNIPKPPRGH